MRLFKEIVTTLVVGSLLGGGILAGAAYGHLPIPEPGQRPIFFIGVVLFSVAFRLLMSIKEEEN